MPWPPRDILLTDEQIRHATYIGLERWLMGRRERRVSTRPLGKHNVLGIEGDCMGALGEQAVAVWADEPWDGNLPAFLANLRGDPPRDVRDWEVKTTGLWNGHLVLGRKDAGKLDVKFILAT